MIPIPKEHRMSIKKFGDTLSLAFKMTPEESYIIAYCTRFFTLSRGSSEKTWHVQMEEGTLYEGDIMTICSKNIIANGHQKIIKDWTRAIKNQNVQDYISKRIFYNDWGAEIETEFKAIEENNEDLSIPNAGEIVFKTEEQKKKEAEYRFEQITKYDNLKKKNQIWIEEGNFGVKTIYLKIVPSQNMVSAVKSIQGYRYDPERKLWAFPYSYLAKIKEFANEQNFVFHDDTMVEIYGDPEKIAASKESHADFHPMGLRLEPYPYQKAGIKFGSKTKKVLIADEMGLGKTIQGIGIITHNDAFPVICVVPSSLMYNWKAEWEKWTRLKAFIYHGVKTDMSSILRYADIVIVSYNGVSKVLKYGNLFKSIIFDESHYIKSQTTQRYKNAYQLALEKEFRICLTGTPIMNRPEELIPQLKVLNMLKDPKIERNFRNRYCSGKFKADNLEELNMKLRSTIMIRREKADVLQDLPDLTRTIIEVDITTREEYDKAEYDFIQYLKEVKNYSDRKIRAAQNAEILVKMNMLKQISARGKIEAIKEFVQSANDDGEKVVVFASHRETINSLKDFTNAPYVITGDTDVAFRQVQVDDFQKTNEIKNFLLSIRAASVGLTLTAASIEVFCELDWNPAIHDQAEARCHRIGQKSAVNAYYFIGKNTVDETIMMLIDKKREIINRATGTESTIEQTKSLITDVLLERFNYLAEEPIEG